MSTIEVLCLCVLSTAVASVKAELHMTEEQRAMGKMLHENCVKETGVKEDLITAVSKGQFEENEKLKCYTKCLLEQMGVFSEEDFSIDKEAFIEMVPDEIKPILSDVLDKCIPLGGNNACEMAFGLFSCFYKHEPEKFFII